MLAPAPPSRWPFPFLPAILALAPVGAADPPGSVSRGRELFLREWVPSDPRSPGGDGLGPVFNDSSCVACHNLGGPGGAGPAGKNIRVLFPLRNNFPKPERSCDMTDRTAEREELAKLHPGFRKAGAVVLHRFSTEPSYTRWLQTRSLSLDWPDLAYPDKKPGPPLVEWGASGPIPVVRFEGRNIAQSQRNPTALFGGGLIDKIPSQVITFGASRQHPGFPEVRGRASLLSDGRVGRFGWKAQTATLAEFTRAACAVELGLEVPGRPQAGLPHRPDYRAPGLDLTRRDLQSLVAFVRSLPVPVEQPGALGPRAQGKTVFARIGCATCHVPDLGPAKGIYSDLLLHDMGEAFEDFGAGSGSGSYGVFVPEIAGARPQGGKASGGGKKEDAEPVASTRPREWRTPPLWGVRDSAPYLHDGRAVTLEEAVLLHGGAAEKSSGLFKNLSHDERSALIAFLKSLMAPH